MSSEPGRERVEREMASERRRVEERCRELVADRLQGCGAVREAVEYSLLGGGKRLRPLLCLWTHDAYGGGHDAACLDTACAIECLHTYSLVHDDLPCMDDDDIRRGRPSCHKKFGEAIAVLAGDAMLTLCFEILFSMGGRHPVDAGTVVEVGRVVAAAAGAGGLIGGQALDLLGERLAPDLENVEEIHRRKTAALIAAAMECGAVMAGADTAGRKRAREAGYLAGAAFQIVDDILDLRADRETLGKTPGKDAIHGKLTYPAVAGLEVSEGRARELAGQARALMAAGAGDSKLLRLLDTVVSRSS